MKSGSLNLLEPSGPVQACNGTALTLSFTSITVSGLKCSLRVRGIEVRHNLMTSLTMQVQALREHCALLGYYTASSVNSLPTFQDNLSVPSPRAMHPRTLKHGTYGLPRNVNKELTELVALYRRRAQFSGKTVARRTAKNS